MKRNSCVVISVILIIFGIYCCFYRVIANQLLDNDSKLLYRMIDEVVKNDGIVRFSYGKSGIYLTKDDEMPLLLNNTDNVVQAKVLRYGEEEKELLMVRNDGTVSLLSIDNAFDDKVIIANNLACLNNITSVYNINNEVEGVDYYSVIVKDKDGSTTDITEALIEIEKNI